MRGKLYYAKITLQDEVTEGSTGLPFLTKRQQIPLRSLLETLESISENRRIHTVFLVIRSLSIGWAQIEEIHSALAKVRKAGQRIIAYLENGDNKTFYLASAAQRVVMPPSATLDFVGLRLESFHLRGLLDSVGIRPELYAVGRYKSAGDIFLRQDMSPASREMFASLLDDIQLRLLEKVAARSGLEPERLQKLVDDGPFSATQARRAGLIDGIAYQDEVAKSLKEDSPPLKYWPAPKLVAREGLLKRILRFRRPQIAYLLADGTIATGESRRGRRRPVLGSRSLAALLDKVRKNKRVKAIVLRVNSPGGSGLAADLLWREIKRTNTEKPVIVSLGDMAASGGYYIAAAGRQIFASPSTLTGSIGVLGGKFSVRELMDRLSIGADSVEKGARSGYSSPTRPFTDEEAGRVQGLMAEFYEDLFLSRVAEGRGTTTAKVNSVAEGRVWTGAQAHSNGLVDQIGGSSEAIEAARLAARLKPRKFRLIQYPRRRRLRDLLPGSLETVTSTDAILALLPFQIRIR